MKKGNLLFNYFDVIKKPIISRLFLASLFNNISLASYTISLTIIVYSQIPNTLVLGIVVSAASLASLLSPLTGHVVDAHFKKSVIMTIRTLDVFVFLTLGIVVALHLPEFIVIVVLIAFVVELNNYLRGYAVSTIYQLFLKESKDTVRFRSIQGTTFWVTHAIMPVIVGYMIAGYGDLVPFVFIALLILPQIILYSSLKFEETIQNSKGKLKESISDSIKELRRLIKSDSTYTLLIFLPIMHAFFTSGTYILIVALIYKLHNFAIGYGIIASVGLAGNAIGTLLAGFIKLKRGYWIITIFTLTFILDIPVGLFPTFPIMLIFLTLSGLFYYIVATHFEGLRLVFIPREYYGRISGITDLLQGIATIAGTLILSSLALLFPARLIYLYSVIILSVITCLMLLSKKLRSTSIAQRDHSQ